MDSASANTDTRVPWGIAEEVKQAYAAQFASET